MRYLCSLLLCLMAARAEAAISLPVYWSYSWETRTLSLFWMCSPVSTQGFEVELSRWDQDTATCGGGVQTSLAVTRTSAANLSFTGINPGRYAAAIRPLTSTGIPQDTGCAARVFIVPALPEFKLGWCGSDGSAITGVNVYDDDTPGFQFGGEPRQVPDYRAMTDAWQTGYFSRKNLIYTNVAGEVESGPSEQIIIYAIMPGKPEWRGVQ